MPVREAMDVHDSGGDSLVEDVGERALDVDGVEWTARVLGRCRGGPAAAPADLLLLGFSSSGEGPPELECLVASRTLSQLTDLQLTSALAEATPPRDPQRPTSLFSGTMQRLGRRS
jgi:hypothetical protein